MSKNTEKIKRERRRKRHLRFTSKIKGTTMRPRISVFRSNKHIYTQIIDDIVGRTLTSASDLELSKPNKKLKVKSQKSKVDIAFEVGALLAQKAKENKISKVVFDKSGYKFHGRVKAFAQGVRKEGLKF